jgi:hypothetical protein
MRILPAYVAVVLVTSITASLGGQCSPQIDQVQAKIDAKLVDVKNAHRGRSGRRTAQLVVRPTLRIYHAVNLAAH